MTPKLDAELTEKYPLILAERYFDQTETAMCWGFEHSDGWYNILNTAMECIQNHIEFRKRLGMEIEQVVFEQVKEKYGTLRIYARGGNDYTNGIIDMAERMSRHTCEICGSPGYTNDRGWIRTLCFDHHKEWSPKQS